MNKLRIIRFFSPLLVLLMLVPQAVALADGVPGCTVTGALAVGNQRLGVAVSTNPVFAIHYFTLQSGANTAVVRDPALTSWTGAGTPNATASVKGTVSSATGVIGQGDVITATLKLANGLPGKAIARDVTTGVTFTLAPPFLGTSTLSITTP